MTYQEALDRALSLAGYPAALEAFLRTVPQWRTDLEQAIAVSRVASRELNALTPDESVVERSREQLMQRVAGFTASEAPQRPGPLARLMGLLNAPRLVVATASAIVLLFAAALVVELPPFSGGGTQTAEAVIIEGSVSEVGAGGVTVSSDGESRVVELSGDTLVMDGFGNVVEASQLSPGQDIVLTGRRSGDEIVVNQVELRDRLFGEVTFLSEDSIRISSRGREYELLLTPETEFEGPVAVGAYVEADLEDPEDGRLVAEEIEVEEDDRDDRDDNSGPGSRDDDDDDDDSSGPGSTDDDDDDSSGPGSGDDDDDDDDDD